MRKLKSIISIYIAVWLTLSSCTEKVDVSLPNGGERLVIEASINWEKGTDGKEQVIKLSQSTAYFEAKSTVPVTGAVVSVKKDNDGSVFQFVDQGDGQYKASDFVPEIGSSYTLEIDYNNKKYMATETLQSVTEIARVEQSVETIFGTDEIKITMYFGDPVEADNYYLGEFNIASNPVPSLGITNDQFTNGNENFMEYDNELNKLGQEVEITLFGISEQYHNYMVILIDQAGGDGGPFPTTPVKLKGNCRNVNNPNEEVLGFFRLSEVSTKTYTIK